MRAVVVWMVLSRVAAADQSVATTKTACHVALEAASHRLAEDGWGVVADEPSIVESNGRIELVIDFSTSCMHHGYGRVVIEPRARRTSRWSLRGDTLRRSAHGLAATVEYSDRNESETGTRQQREPFFRHMKAAVDACLDGATLEGEVRR